MGNEIVKRGDSFDIGEPGQHNVGKQSEDILMSIVSNPSAFVETLGLTEAQAKNLASVITGSGSAFGYKYLSDAFGPEIAGAIGGFVGGYVAKKVVRKVRQ